MHRELCGDIGARKQLLAFVARNRVVLNVILHQNPLLLESSMKIMIVVPQCRQFLHFDIKRAFFKARLRRLRQDMTRAHGPFHLNIRRSHMFEDSFQKFRNRPAEDLRRRLSVMFHGEEGVDAGGLTREWYSLLSREIFNANYALFVATNDGSTFQPNPVSYVNEEHLEYFKFVGRVIGKAICDGELLDAHFTRSFYKHILGVPVTYHDMEAIDPQYYKNLCHILENNLDDLGLELTFTAETSNLGQMSTVELVPGGTNIAVTEDNKQEYVRLITKHRMTTAISSQISAFLGGFRELVPPELISIFSATELELLISGLPDIDLEDLRMNTEYHGYSASDQHIQWFWNALRSFSKEELALFLQYVTGTSKVPLDGFAQLQGMRGVQRFNIHKEHRTHFLPTAHTCFNQLDLPEYASEEDMREKLLTAIKSGSQGFGFA